MVDKLITQWLISWLLLNVLVVNVLVSMLNNKTVLEDQLIEELVVTDAGDGD